MKTLLSPFWFMNLLVACLVICGKVCMPYSYEKGYTDGWNKALDTIQGSFASQSKADTAKITYVYFDDTLRFSISHKKVK